MDENTQKWHLSVMDSVRKIILDTAEQRGISLKDLSLRLGKNHAYLHQFIHRGTPKKLDGDDRATLSQILQLPENILGGFSPKAETNSPLRMHLPNATLVSGEVKPGPLVPLYGTAVGGVYGQFELNGSVLDTIVAPVSLAGVRNAYAVRVAGESMEPRYEDGETVFVDPDRRPTRNDYVVAQIRETEDGPLLAYVKKFVRWNSEKLVLSQLNPVQDLEFDAKCVHSVHYILRSGE